MTHLEHIRRLTELLDLRDDWVDLLNAVGRPIVVMDSATNRILAVNNEAERLFGRTWVDVVGCDIKQVLPILAKNKQEEPVIVDLQPSIKKAGGCIVVSIERM